MTYAPKCTDELDAYRVDAQGVTRVAQGGRSAQWLKSVDPLAASMPSYSPYAYTFNDPINYTDPTGMIPYESNWMTGSNRVYQASGYDASGMSIGGGSTGGESVGGQEDTREITYDENGRASSVRLGAGFGGGEEECCPGLVGFAGAAVAADVATPDPTDVLPWKWAAYGIGAVVAGGVTAYNYYNSPAAQTNFLDPYIVRHRRVTDREVDDIAREWGYEDAHDLKDAHDVGSEMDIYIDDKTKDLILRRNPKGGRNKVPDQPVYPNN